MKRIVSLILMLVLCLSFSACAELADCKALIGNAINLENYDEPDVDEDSVSIWRTEKAPVVFDFTANVADGPAFALNGKTVYQDLLDLGWSSNMPEIAEGYYSYMNSCDAPDGRWVTISLSNPTEGDMPIAETYVTGVTFVSDYSPDFDASGISFASTLADLVAVFGEPYTIYYSETVGLSLKFEDENISSLKVVIGSDGALKEFAYSYNRNLL